MLLSTREFVADVGHGAQVPGVAPSVILTSLQSSRSDIGLRLSTLPPPPVVPREDGRSLRLNENRLSAPGSEVHPQARSNRRSRAPDRPSRELRTGMLTLSRPGLRMTVSVR